MSVSIEIAPLRLCDGGGCGSVVVRDSGSCVRRVDIHSLDQEHRKRAGIFRGRDGVSFDVVCGLLTKVASGGETRSRNVTNRPFPEPIAEVQPHELPPQVNIPRPPPNPVVLQIARHVDTRATVSSDFRLLLPHCASTQPHPTNSPSLTASTNTS